MTKTDVRARVTRSRGIVGVGVVMAGVADNAVSSAGFRGGSGRRIDSIESIRYCVSHGPHSSNAPRRAGPPCATSRAGPGSRRRRHPWSSAARVRSRRPPPSGCAPPRPTWPTPAPTRSRRRCGRAGSARWRWSSRGRCATPSTTRSRWPCSTAWPRSSTPRAGRCCSWRSRSRTPSAPWPSSRPRPSTRPSSRCAASCDNPVARPPAGPRRARGRQRRAGAPAGGPRAHRRGRRDAAHDPARARARPHPGRPPVDAAHDPARRPAPRRLGHRAGRRAAPPTPTPPGGSPGSGRSPATTPRWCRRTTSRSRPGRPRPGCSSTCRRIARPTAVVAQADLLAAGVVRAAEALGLRVPQDLTVTGFDGVDLPWLDHVLTTVEQPGRRQGPGDGPARAARARGPPDRRRAVPGTPEGGDDLVVPTLGHPLSRVRWSGARRPCVPLRPSTKARRDGAPAGASRAGRGTRRAAAADGCWLG